MFDKRGDLKKLLTVVEEGKIHSAAEKLHITQPALSRVIAKLERQFNGQIFERVPKGVRLTQFGAIVLDQVRHILREIEHAEEEINLTLKGGERKSENQRRPPLDARPLAAGHQAVSRGLPDGGTHPQHHKLQSRHQTASRGQERLALRNL